MPALLQVPAGCRALCNFHCGGRCLHAWAQLFVPWSSYLTCAPTPSTIQFGRCPTASTLGRPSRAHASHCLGPCSVPTASPGTLPVTVSHGFVLPHSVPALVADRGCRSAVLLLGSVGPDPQEEVRLLEEGVACTHGSG